MAGGRGAGIKRTLTLVGELLSGRTLNRRRAAALLGVRPAAADRQLRVVKTLPLVVRNADGELELARPPAGMAATIRMAVATCFASGLVRVLRGTTYELAMAEALTLLTSALPRRARFQHLQRKFLFLERGGDPSVQDDRSTLDEVIDAVLDSRFLRLRYQHFRGQLEWIEFMPLSVAIHEHQVYLLGRQRTEFKALRFSRIQRATKLEKRFTYPERAEYDPDVIFGGSFGVFVNLPAPIETVRVRLESSWAAYARTHKWHRSQVTTMDGAHPVISLSVRVCPELESWVLGFGEEAEVLEPLHLRRRIARRLQLAARRANGHPPPVKTTASNVRRGRKGSSS